MAIRIVGVDLPQNKRGQETKGKQRKQKKNKKKR